MRVAVAAPYSYALAILRSRYDVGFESGRLRTTAGRSVPEEALHALTPGGTAGALVLLALALVGLASLGPHAGPGSAIALALWLAVPVLFFTLVPASTRFFGRYLAPAEPAFYVLVAAGCLDNRQAPARGRCGARSRASSRSPSPSASTICARSTISACVSSSAAVDSEGILFSSTGTPVSDRPPELLDDYLELEGLARPGASRSCRGSTFASSPTSSRTGRANVAAFVAGGKGGRGLWIFRGPERRVTRAIRRLGDDAELAADRQSPTLLLIRSRTAAAPPALIEQGIRARTAWTLASPADRWTTLLLEIGRSARPG